MSFLIALHFILAISIIFFVILQRSSETSVLVSSTHFAPGGANKLLVRITRALVVLFLLNCLAISYIKYHKSHSVNIDNLAKTTQTSAKVPSVPVN